MIQRIKDSLLGKAPFAAKRNPLWPKVRREHLQQFPFCAACGSRKKLEAHHRIPFHLSPSLELTKSNLITLCRDHHLLIGHLGNYKFHNVYVHKWANMFLEEIILQRKVKNEQF